MSATPENAAPLRAHSPLTRADFHAAQGVLLVVRNPPPAPPPVKGQPALVAGNPAEGVEILIAVWDDGSVTALNGHVDLGTGLRTALAQVVAEELEVPIAQHPHGAGRHGTRAPNQGATIASASHADTCRAAAHCAAAQARALVGGAGLRANWACRWRQFRCVPKCGAGQARHVAPTGLRRAADAAHTPRWSWWMPSPPRRRPTTRVVGQSVPRVSISKTNSPVNSSSCTTCACPACCTAGCCARRMRVPTMATSSATTLESVDQQSSIAHIPGIRAVVVIRDFRRHRRRTRGTGRAGLAAI